MRNIKQFIDYDKKKLIFYVNLYLKEYHIVIKIPLCNYLGEIYSKDIKIRKFNLSECIYILTFDDKNFR